MIIVGVSHHDDVESDLTLDFVEFDLREDRLVADTDGVLELGRAVELTIIMPAIERVIALPLQSVYDNKRVFTINEGRLRGVEVAPIGQRINAQGKLEILVKESALKSGVAILASNLPKAASGLKVKVINDDKPQLAAVE
jgi:hypothetical protein